jgi:hypothetical protein
MVRGGIWVRRTSTSAEGRGQVRLSARVLAPHNMIGDHHERSAGRATLLVRAVDAIFGTHRVTRSRGTGEAMITTRGHARTLTYSSPACRPNSRHPERLCRPPAVRRESFAATPRIFAASVASP